MTHQYGGRNTGFWGSAIAGLLSELIPGICRSFQGRNHPEGHGQRRRRRVTKQPFQTYTVAVIMWHHQTKFNTPSGTWCFDAFCVNVSDDISSTWPFWRWAEHVQSSPHILLRRPAAVFRGLQYQEWMSQLKYVLCRRLDRTENRIHLFPCILLASLLKVVFLFKKPFKYLQVISNSQSIEPSSRVSWPINRSSSVFDHWWSLVGESTWKTVLVNQASRVYSLSVTLLGIRHVWNCLDRSD